MSKFSTHRIRAIAKKEVVEFVRDWRTIMAIIVIPLLMFPLLFILFPILLESEAAELDALELTVIVQSNSLEESMEQAIVGAGIDIVMEPLDNQSQLSEPGEDLERVRNGRLTLFYESRRTIQHGIMPFYDCRHPNVPMKPGIVCWMH